LLKCVEVSKAFGGLQALKKVDLVVGENEIVGLVGPNGSGKSTMLNLISGVYKPDEGKILFRGEDIARKPPYVVCAKGITKTSQTVQSFPDMTMLENVLTGVLFSEKKAEKKMDATDRAKEILEFVGLPKEKINLQAKNLNVIELRRVQLARAIATQPKMLLLDELLTGLTPKESDEAIELVKLINKQGVTILMVEHIMRIIMGLCSRVVVLNHGEKICEGKPEAVCTDPEVIKIYLRRLRHGTNPLGRFIPDKTKRNRQHHWTKRLRKNNSRQNHRRVHSTQSRNHQIQRRKHRKITSLRHRKKRPNHDSRRPRNFPKNDRRRKPPTWRVHRKR
jgi:branched-chain amino acid transport system ATP-binding protein